MENVESKGITLVTLVITVIVLLMLVGIVLTITNTLVINKSIKASNNTIESGIIEKIEIILNECDILFWNEKSKNVGLEKADFYNDKLSKILTKNNEFTNIIVNYKDDNSLISLDYQKNGYRFIIEKDGSVNNIYNLKEKVEVGDYINYLISYSDVFSLKEYQSNNGWKVIDDGKMTGTSGNIKIVSVGIPQKWYYNSSLYSSGQDAVIDLTNNFANQNLINTNTGEIVKGSIYLNSNFATSVTTLTLSDFNCAYNVLHGTLRIADDVNMFDDKDEFFYSIGNNYVLATNNDMNLYYVSVLGIKPAKDMRFGIRPVIVLKDDLFGKFNSGIWEILNE